MINKLVKEANENAKQKGWWDEDRTFGEQIALMHSELSEALEDHRNGNSETLVYYECKANYLCGGGEDCFKCPNAKPCGIPTELADTIIRIFDTCGRYGIDLESAIKQKMKYNKSRSYKHGGKVI